MHHNNYIPIDTNNNYCMHVYGHGSYTFIIYIPSPETEDAEHYYAPSSLVEV